MSDKVQHGIDDNPTGDAEKGAALGGLGGAGVGALAGSAAGPVGTVIGAVAGGLMGAGASGAAVAAVDQVDNDNTVTGVGHGSTRDVNTSTGVGGSSTNTNPMAGTGPMNAGYQGAGYETSFDPNSGSNSLPRATTETTMATGMPSTTAHVSSVGESHVVSSTPVASAHRGEQVGVEHTTVVETLDSNENFPAGSRPATATENAAVDRLQDSTQGSTYSGADTGVGGHNVVTGDEAHTGAGKAGLATGAVVGGLIGTAVAGPVGAIVGGTIGSLAGGASGDAAEVADEEDNGTRR